MEPLPLQKRKSADVILAVSAIVLCTIILGFFIWGTTSLADHLGRAINPPPTKTSAMGFNIESAQKLNFRGLNSQ